MVCFEKAVFSEPLQCIISSISKRTKRIYVLYLDSNNSKLYAIGSALTNESSIMPGHNEIIMPILWKNGHIEFTTFTCHFCVSIWKRVVFAFLFSFLLFYYFSMVPKPHWSRDYFTENDETGKFECNFGCGAKYKESSTKFTHHLLVSSYHIAFLIGLSWA